MSYIIYQMPVQIILFVIGVGVLYAGGMVFIRGASNAAFIFNIRPIVIGVVVVAFATSAPEFFVSVLAVFRGNQSLAIGNIIGSCICNIGMVLGISSIIQPVKVEGMILRREMPILLIATSALFVFSLDLVIDRAESFFLLCIFAAFIIYCIKNAKKIQNNRDKAQREKRRFSAVFAHLVLGLTGLLVGAYIVVNSSLILARHIGISELVIGITLVAVGTSLPELFASISAARQSEGDICIGNVVGSNIFNILAIVGVVGIISPISLDRNVLNFSLLVLILYTVTLIPIIKTGYAVSRKEGIVLLLGYFLYLWRVFKL
jgi:cation:H+ antiporter